MSKILAGDVGSLTACANGVLRFPLTSHPLRGGAVFLDRDGVINRRIPDGYVTRLDEFEFMPDAIREMRALAALTRPIIVLSNQAAVAKKLVTVRALEQITSWFVAEIVAGGGRIDAVYYCPHAPADDCQCRKPRPGLFFQAAKDFSLDLAQSVMIGDSVSDVEAARNAGSHALLIERERPPETAAFPPTYDVVPNLDAAVAAIESL